LREALLMSAFDIRRVWRARPEAPGREAEQRDTRARRSLVQELAEWSREATQRRNAQQQAAPPPTRIRPPANRLAGAFAEPGQGLARELQGRAFRGEDTAVTPEAIQRGQQAVGAERLRSFAEAAPAPATQMRYTVLKELLEEEGIEPGQLTRLGYAKVAGATSDSRLGRVRDRFNARMVELRQQTEQPPEDRTGLPAPRGMSPQERDASLARSMQEEDDRLDRWAQGRQTTEDIALRERQNNPPRNARYGGTPEGGPFELEQQIFTPWTRPAIKWELDHLPGTSRLPESWRENIAKYGAEFAVPSTLLGGIGKAGKAGKLARFGTVAVREGFINAMQDKAGREVRGEPPPSLQETAAIGVLGGALAGTIDAGVIGPAYRKLRLKLGAEPTADEVIEQIAKDTGRTVDELVAIQDRASPDLAQTAQGAPLETAAIREPPPASVTVNGREYVPAPDARHTGIMDEGADVASSQAGRSAEAAGLEQPELSLLRKERATLIERYGLRGERDPRKIGGLNKSEMRLEYLDRRIGELEAPPAPAPLARGPMQAEGADVASSQAARPIVAPRAPASDTYHEMGTVGEFLRDPELRNVYSDYLDVPVRFHPGLTPEMQGDDIARTLGRVRRRGAERVVEVGPETNETAFIHEVEHLAEQDGRGVFGQQGEAASRAAEWEWQQRGVTDRPLFPQFAERTARTTDEIMANEQARRSAPAPLARGPMQAEPAGPGAPSRAFLERELRLTERRLAEPYTTQALGVGQTTDLGQHADDLRATLRQHYPDSPALTEPPPTPRPTMRDAVKAENAAGGRLRVRQAKTNLDQGPLIVSGTDRRGRRIDIQGTEMFLRDDLQRMQAPPEAPPPAPWRPVQEAAEGVSAYPPMPPERIPGRMYAGRRVRVRDVGLGTIAEDQMLPGELSVRLDTGEVMTVKRNQVYAPTPVPGRPETQIGPAPQREPAPATAPTTVSRPVPETAEGREFYVTVRDPERPKGGHGWLAGPYKSHDEALADLPGIRRQAAERDPSGHWYEYGTASRPAGDTPKTITIKDTRTAPAPAPAPAPLARGPMQAEGADVASSQAGRAAGATAGETQAQALRRLAQDLRSRATRGQKTRAYAKQAAELEAQADALDPPVAAPVSEFVPMGGDNPRYVEYARATGAESVEAAFERGGGNSGYIRWITDKQNEWRRANDLPPHRRLTPDQDAAFDDWLSRAEPSAPAPLARGPMQAEPASRPVQEAAEGVSETVQAGGFVPTEAARRASDRAALGRAPADTTRRLEAPLAGLEDDLDATGIDWKVGRTKRDEFIIQPVKAYEPWSTEDIAALSRAARQHGWETSRDVFKASGDSYKAGSVLRLYPARARATIDISDIPDVGATEAEGWVRPHNRLYSTPEDAQAAIQKTIEMGDTDEWRVVRPPKTRDATKPYMVEYRPRADAAPPEAARPLASAADSAERPGGQRVRTPRAEPIFEGEVNEARTLARTDPEALDDASDDLLEEAWRSARKDCLL
jgi:hypothetical protein